MPDANDLAGLNFGGPKAQGLQQRLAAKWRENGRRVPCPRCALTILPENLANHLAVVHDQEARP